VRWQSEAATPLSGAPFRPELFEPSDAKATSRFGGPFRHMLMSSLNILWVRKGGGALDDFFGGFFGAVCGTTESWKWWWVVRGARGRL
jgi:hypothetical protein